MKSLTQDHYITLQNENRSRICQPRSINKRETEEIKKQEEQGTKTAAEITKLKINIALFQNKILLTGNHGKNSFNNKELLETATSIAKVFTKNDIIIFWPNLLIKYLIKISYF